MAKDKPKPAKIIKAVALRYLAEEAPAQVMTAKGEGKLAERIMALAREHGIPIREDPDLVEVLSRLDIAEEIPPEVYVVVAEILSFAYNTNQDYAQRHAESLGPHMGRDDNL